jgi:Icc-related predicted phosphoesterase
MKILALSDLVLKKIYSPQLPELYGDAELVLGCGDLPYYYLEYIVTMLPVEVLYVYGNHDKLQYNAKGQPITTAEGCLLIDGRVVEINGLLIAGLGGSIRYSPRAPHQYTEQEMMQRIWQMAPALVRNRLTKGRYLDILVTHSPPLGIHDGDDRAHTGFKAFLTFMRYFKPRYLLHGHKHLYRRDEITQTRFENTEVINVYPNRVIYW